jgi:phospholipid/cholesterol/gamma-HCH transport system substrate-binding protein
MRLVRQYGKFLAVIAVLAVLAIASAVFILTNQRLRTPLQDRYTVNVDITSASGLTPGLGQAVNVAGVRVGQISASRLVDGVARISAEVDPHKLPHVYTNAKAALIPNTPLKDMLLELSPGGPPAKPLKDGGIIPAAQSDPPVDSDELTSALDADTRDFLRVLTADSADGLRNRGDDLNSLLKAFEPTARQLQDVQHELAGRRQVLKRLVGNLAILTRAAASKDQQIGQVVERANATFQAISSQDQALGRSLDKLPDVLSAVSNSLPNVADFGREVRPTLQRLLPVTRQLPDALRALDPLLVATEPALRTGLRPLARNLQPVAKDLDPATQKLNSATPDLSQSFQVLNYVVNVLGYNPPGDDEGFLYWLSWFAHNAASALSQQDAHGAAIRGLVLTSCSSIAAQPAVGDLLDLLVGSVQGCKTR